MAPSRLQLILTTSDHQPRATKKYRLLFHPEALIEWRNLDGSVSKPLKKLLEKRLNHPHVPGNELARDLAGCYKIKLRKQGARMVYVVDDTAITLTVMAVGRREDGLVYRFAAARAR